ncbi:glycosyltransferase [Nocardioides limicola]|uniref:glycosyltransferase n=1 Tax=Nocardioides limicola TaxID=2803368 RepID=UPI00193B85C8|nr:glycosyltransferase [Nocardioides sp. DJM-14]
MSGKQLPPAVHPAPIAVRAPATGGDPVVTRLLQRQIMPAKAEIEAIRLYVDPEPLVLDADKYDVGSNRKARELNSAMSRQGVQTGATIHPEQIESRTSIRIEAGESLSFGSYFNAFAASYWRRWTVVTEVDLAVTIRGRGAKVSVFRSMANGRSQQVAGAVNAEDLTTHSFRLTLKPFTDGGWYWYDVVAPDDSAVVVETAEWTAQVPADLDTPGTVTIGITTMNRPDFCAKLLASLGDHPELALVLDRVLVMEQGKDLVVDSDHFDAALEALGKKLRIITQGNLGGSGGFARAQYEALKADESTYCLMLDDDVECEPEGIVRAATFGDLCRRPTIVGGHMFSIYHKTQLHSFGERVAPYRFWWGSAPNVIPGWDLTSRNLRSTRWMHMRVDVDYNGWFMCLIPLEVLRTIGLSLPVFIKWDDSEYGLRAKEAGYPTVTLPGAAVWHVPWTDKNDALDWQAYFHVRNRFIAALLHSQYPRGGRMLLESFNHQVKHLVSMQYSTAALRHRALQDVLAGPEGLHDALARTLPEIRELSRRYSDGQTESDPEAFPSVRPSKLARRLDDGRVASRSQEAVTALLQPLRQFRKPRELARHHPETAISATDAKWYRISKYDSAVVSMPDGTAAAFYRRDRELFAGSMKETMAIHKELASQWDALAERYREALSEITSPEAWEKTFAPWLGSDE